MHIAELHLVNYKNLNNKFSFKPGINLIIAPNGTGKTNLLEAIEYLATSKSFRGVGDEFVYPMEKNVDVVGITAKVKKTDDELNRKIRLIWQVGRKYAEIDGDRTNFSKLHNSINTLVHAPTTIDIVTDGAALRRNFLDQTIMKLAPEIKPTIQNYGRAVRSRNRLLKTQRIDPSQMKFWNTKIAEFGEIIFRERNRLLEALQPMMEQLAKNLYHQDDYQVSFNYISKYKDANSLLNLLNKNTHKEAAVGQTLYGPHRDDLEFLLGKMSVRQQSSRGQQRLYSLILHLSILELISAELGYYPILILDDVLSELDKVHRTNTLNHLERLVNGISNVQIFISSPDEKIFPLKFRRNSNLIIF